MRKQRELHILWCDLSNPIFVALGLDEVDLRGAVALAVREARVMSRPKDCS